MNDNVKKFLEDCKLLVGLPCWAFSAGAGTGTVFKIVLGRKFPRVVPLKNPNLATDYRENKGEFSLLVECAWRLDNKKEIFCGSLSDNRPGGPMLLGLSNLIGQKIEQIELNHPGLDLKINFEQGLQLTIFCDQVNELDESDNYSFFFPWGIYTVSNMSALEFEKAEKSGATLRLVY